MSEFGLKLALLEFCFESPTWDSTSRLALESRSDRGMFFLLRLIPVFLIE